MNILLVEDNKSIAKGLIYSFKLEYDKDIIHMEDYRSAKKYIDDNYNNISIVILDVTLPDGNGFDLYKEVISIYKLPTLFLTANDDEDEIVKGLELGADDYITKPFNMKELLVRVNKIILRNKKDNIIKVEDITFDLDKLELYKGNNLVELSSLELKLVNLLFININKVVSRNLILDNIWEWTGNYVDDHTVTVYFGRIREKIKSDIIKTVKGIGYRIDEEK